MRTWNPKDGHHVPSGWLGPPPWWNEDEHPDDNRQASLDDEADRLLQRKRDREAGEELEGREVKG